MMALRCVGGHMRLLRHQRRSTGISLVAKYCPALITSVTYSSLAQPKELPSRTCTGAERASFVLDNAYYPPETHGRIAMHLQNGQEQLVQLILRDGLAGHHLDLPFDRRVHHDGRAGRPATNLISSWISVSLRLTVKSWARVAGAANNRTSTAANRALRDDRFTRFT